jgi:chaperone BCS1
LDPALIRPGRVDVKQYIGYATEHQLFGMFKNFYPDAADSLAKQFAQSVISLNSKLSAAQVQGFFMLFKNEPNKAMENIEMFKN